MSISEKTKKAKAAAILLGAAKTDIKNSALKQIADPVWKAKMMAARNKKKLLDTQKE